MKTHSQTMTDTRADTHHQEDTEKITKGVSILTGDPKTAILKLSGHMIIAMLLLSAYNLVDAIWVAGLGPGALAAVGFITPFFMIIIGIGVGTGAGTSSAIARRIGARDKTGADNTAGHAILLAIMLSVFLTIFLLIFIEPLVISIGAGETAYLAVEYGQVIFIGTFFMLFTNIAYGILRSEGDTKRTMYAMGAASIVNIILDPVLIYGAGMGVAGAAWATVISMGLVSGVLAYWFVIKKDTYVSFSYSSFVQNKAIYYGILSVGVPASLEFFLMAVMQGILNLILVMVSGTDAVAVYTASWRVVMFAIVPLIAIGTTVVSVAGATYGSKQYEKLSLVHTFSIQLGIGISIITAILTWIFAPFIAALFTYSETSVMLTPSIVVFLQIFCLFYLFVPPGIMSGSLFQGTGRGTTSLVINFFRSIVFIVLFAYLFAVVMDYGEIGVLWGLVTGNIIGGAVAYIWTRLYIVSLIKNDARKPTSSE